MVWLLLVLFVAIALAVVRGGRLSNLAEIRPQLWFLLPLGFILQAIAGFVPETSSSLGVGLILVSYLPLLGLVFANRHSPGMMLTGVGVILNFVVIAVNGGMPVLQEAAVVASGWDPTPLVSEGYKHVMLDPQTRLSFLSDVIPVRLFGQGQVISLGDVLLAAGLATFLQAELRKPVRWFKRGVKLQGGSASSPR